MRSAKLGGRVSNNVHGGAHGAATGILQGGRIAEVADEAAVRGLHHVGAGSLGQQHGAAALLAQLLRHDFRVAAVGRFDQQCHDGGGTALALALYRRCRGQLVLFDGARQGLGRFFRLGVQLARQHSPAVGIVGQRGGALTAHGEQAHQLPVSLLVPGIERHGAVGMVERLGEIAAALISGP